MKNRVLRLLTLINLGLLSSIAQADIYEYIDAAGVSHYSDVQSHDQYVMVLKTTPEPTNNQIASVPAVNHPSTDTNNSQVNTATASIAPPQLLAQIEQSAQNNQIQSELIHAVIQAESAYQVKAQSPKGAQGLMQLMPQTAKRFGVKDSYDPIQNIEGGAKYLKELLILFNNDLTLTLAAYNAGENAVIKYGNKIPPYKETQAYVPKVMKVYIELMKQKGHKIQVI